RAALKTTFKEFESAQGRLRSHRGAAAVAKANSEKGGEKPSADSVAVAKPAATNDALALAKPAATNSDAAAAAAADEEEDKEEYAELPVRVLAHRDAPLEVHLLKRGELEDPADVVDAGLPKKLAGEHPFAEVPSGKRRAELANWLASERNPLTARVIVN